MTSEPVADYVGEGISSQNGMWTFGNGVADHFSDHVSRSIPGYRQGHDLVCMLSDFFVRSDSVCFEIGASLGELTGQLAKRHAVHQNCRWVGIDAEPEMIRKARSSFGSMENVTFEVADVIDYELARTDLVISYYCLQFVAPKARQVVVDKIYRALEWGGAFIWFEKVRGSDARFQDIYTLLYTDFKLKQGYAPDEIIAKSRSLKGVLEPFSSEANRDILHRAGFADVTTVFKFLCFEGVLAIK